jgi:hypothetical protein
MALPSQTGRPAARRNYMYRRAKRKRGPRRTVLIAIVIVAAVIVVWQIWPEGDASADPTADAGGGSDQSEVDSDDPFDSLRDIDVPQGSLASDTRSIPAPVQRERGQEPPARRAEPKPVDPPSEIRMGGPLPENALAARTDPEAVGSDLHASRPDPSTPTSTARPAALDQTDAASPESSGSTSRALQVLQKGLQLMEQQPVDARRMLTVVLDSGQLSPRDATNAREALRIINEGLVFSPDLAEVENDPYMIFYVIERNDLLSRLPRKLGVLTNWRFVQRINRIEKPQRIYPGQRIKLITGPFHCVVDKSDFRLDLYLGEGPQRVFVRSFAVGLGEYNSTPVGLFLVKENSKLINPQWVNPRTGRLFKPDDPDNPIGEYWLGLEGAEERVADITGYGIHGTIEPDSIGHQSSMGCIRMLNEDVAVVWEVLIERVSTVEIRP